MLTDCSSIVQMWLHVLVAEWGTKLRNLSLMASVVATSLIGFAATAATVKIEMTATFESAGSGFTINTAGVNDAISAVVVYDDALLNPPVYFNYLTPVVSYNVQIAGVDQQVDPSSPYLNPGSTSFEFFASVTGPENYAIGVEMGLADTGQFYQTDEISDSLVNSGGASAVYSQIFVELASGSTTRWGTCSDNLGSCGLFFSSTDFNVAVQPASSSPVAVTAVPVPAALPLMGLGLLGLGVFGRRRRS